MTDFVHLHVHSEFSLLDGLSKIPKLVDRAKQLGMKHLAITDHGGLYGAVKFYKECKAADVNPIIGCEVYIAKRSRADKESGVDNENFHLTLLATNFEGYKNLMKLVTISHLEGFYYRPRLDKEVLKKYSSGLIALSGCSSSEISKAVIANDLNKAKETATAYQSIFGKNNFYLEIQRHLFKQFAQAHSENSEIHAELMRMAREEKQVIEGAKKLSADLKIPLVATNDVHYIYPDDAGAQDVIVCVQTGKVLSETKRLRMIDSPTYYLKSPGEMVELFEDIPEACENTAKIAAKINIEIPLNKISFPSFKTPFPKTPDKYLQELCTQGLVKRQIKITNEIKERLKYEFSVIFKKHYSTYFLVVADFVNWSREKGIISTTRGSASGSLVAYALGITNVNPLDFKLPFERFLNLYRPTLPDIDVDFADNRRDEVIAYVREKYGQDKVAQIGTFGTMMARAAVRDVARVIGWPYSKADRVAKMIPIGAQGFHMSLDSAKKLNKELGTLYNEDSEVTELLDLAQKVEGNVRHVSVHAAGVVIAPLSLTDYSPLQRETSQEKIITQYDMYDIEEVGLVKMDFLGIRNLSILGHAVDIVAQVSNHKIDLTEITTDDKGAYALLAKGETMGLFQLSGSGMTRYLKELKPTNIFDIMAMISLFRPGPMNSIPEFIERKRNRDRIKYFDTRMESYLKESYGVIVYQDDVLLTAINIAGYSWEEADKFRKAMGKKIPTEMSKQKEKFIEGCIKNGMRQEKAEELFRLIEPFAAYGFNKAHAASYAHIAYQTAYMKSNYPVEFMTAVMTAESDDPDKIAAAVAECARMGILVLPPHVNFSMTGFTVEKSGTKRGIRFGLSAIKNVGKAAMEAIITERDNQGKFKSLNDFVSRVNLRVVNRKTLESLIKAGAMDEFGKRNAMLKVIDEIKTAGTSLSKTVSAGQGSLFEQETIRKDSAASFNVLLDSSNEAPKEEILSWERELLGFYLTEHPLIKFEKQLMQITTSQIADINEIIFNNKNIKIGGIISSIRKTLTKMRREEMCFLKLQDTTGTLEVLVFPKVYAKTRSVIATDQIVVISGKLETGEQTPILIAENIMSLSESLTLPQSNNFEVALPKDADRVLLSKIYQLLKENPGEDSITLILSGENGAARKFAVPFTAKRTQQLTRLLTKLGCRVN